MKQVLQNLWSQQPIWKLHVLRLVIAAAGRHAAALLLLLMMMSTFLEKCRSNEFFFFAAIWIFLSSLLLLLLQLPAAEIGFGFWVLWIWHSWQDCSTVEINSTSNSSSKCAVTRSYCSKAASAELLPKGIVAGTSDLQMRSLAPEDEDMVNNSFSASTLHLPTHLLAPTCKNPEALFWSDQQLLLHSNLNSGTVSVCVLLCD